MLALYVAASLTMIIVLMKTGVLRPVFGREVKEMWLPAEIDTGERVLLKAYVTSPLKWFPEK